MKFIKIDTTQTTPQIERVFDSRSYDLNVTFNLNSKKNIVEVKIEMDDIYQNNHEIKSAIFCQKVISGNDSFYVLLVNMQRGQHNKSLVLKENTQSYPNSITMKTGDIIFIDVYEFDKDNEEIDTCDKVKLFDFDINPNHKNGNILIGNP